MFCFLTSAQVDPGLAKDYFEEGAFEKALTLYQKLRNNQRSNSYYFLKVIECHQQLSQYKTAQKEIEAQMKRFKNPQYLVELGYNYQLQNQLTQADLYYKKAIQIINNSITHGWQGLFPLKEQKTKFPKKQRFKYTFFFEKSEICTFVCK